MSRPPADRAAVPGTAPPRRRPRPEVTPSRATALGPSRRAAGRIGGSILIGGTSGLLPIGGADGASADGAPPPEGAVPEGSGLLGSVSDGSGSGGLGRLGGRLLAGGVLARLAGPAGLLRRLLRRKPPSPTTDRCLPPPAHRTRSGGRAPGRAADVADGDVLLGGRLLAFGRIDGHHLVRVGAGGWIRGRNGGDVGEAGVGELFEDVVDVVADQILRDSSVTSPR